MDELIAELESAYSGVWYKIYKLDNGDYEYYWKSRSHDSYFFTSPGCASYFLFSLSAIKSVHTLAPLTDNNSNIRAIFYSLLEMKRTLGRRNGTEVDAVIWFFS